MKWRTSILPALVATLVLGCNTSTTSKSNGNSTPPAPSSASSTDWQSKLDPQMKAVMDELASLGGKPLPELSAEEARKQPTPADAVKSLLKKQGKPTDPEPVGKVENRKVGQNAVRIYWPKQMSKPAPIVVYYHGGGWVIADLDTYDATPRAISNQTGAIVVSAEYRHAPEHKFPAAHDDAYAAYKWTLTNAKSLGGDPAKIAVMGESAGGNMATVVCLMARDKKDPLPIYQVLVYPVAQYGNFDTPSYQANATANPLNKAMMQWFWEKYLASPADGERPYASPLKIVDVKGMPPATIITAEIDPLLSEGKEYAEKLQKAGVSTEYKEFSGVTHEFFGMAAAVDKARQAQQKVADDLNKVFQH